MNREVSQVRSDAPRSAEAPSAALEAAERRGFGAKLAAPILIGPLLNPINTTMIAVALVPISRSLGVGSSTVIWLVAILYLASAIAQPTMGKLADRFGPRKIYLIGLICVVAAGVLPEIFPGFLGVLVARVFIGIGTSAAYPAAMTMIRDQSQRLGRPAPPLLLSGLSISSLVSGAVGPVLGGLLIAAFGWHSIFLVNVPLAGLAIVLTLMWLPNDRTRPASAGHAPVWQSLDPPGLALFILAMGSLLFFLLDLAHQYWWMLGVFALSGAALIWRELRARLPFIDVRMLVRNGPLSRTYLRLVLTFSCSYLLTYGFSQWVQSSAGFASDVAGFLQLPSAVVAAVCSFLIAKSVKVRVPLLLSAIAPIAGGLVVATLSSHGPLWYLLLVPALFGVPQGLASISNQAVLYRQTPPEYIGTASGLSRTSVYMGAIGASSLIGVMFGNRPSDAGMHVLGFVIVGVSIVSLMTVLLDRSLRRADEKG